MPRRNLIKSDLLPYHVTGRVNNCEDFPLGCQVTWEILCNEALFISLIFGVQIHSLVLMPNHFHMLLTVPEHDLGTVMSDFMKNITQTSNRRSGRSGHLFGGPYYWSLIKSSRYFGHAFKYVYRNPVKANLCTRPEDYPFSTLRGLIGLDRLAFPLFQTRIGMELSYPDADSQEFLPWLSKPFPVEAEKLIQSGLRKREFKLLRGRENRPTNHSLQSFI